MSQIDETLSILRAQPTNIRRNRERRQKKRELGCDAPSQCAERTSPAPDDRASLFGSPNGIVEIKGGEFNATAGNHISVTINSGGTGLREKSKEKQRKKAKPAVQDKNAGQVQRPVVRESERAKIQTESWAPTVPIQRSCDIYYRHLAPKGRGSPLWIPEPNKVLSTEYQRSGMRIGDVGIITCRGNFDFLFNICLPADHPINRKKVPENFVPLLIDPDDIQKYSEFKGESYLSSASIKKSNRDGDSSGLLFESSASEGAILTMPVGLNSEDLGNVGRFRKYAALHAESWYKYVNDVRGREARNGDIRLVTGCDKTTAWGMATFSNSTAQNDSFHLTFRPMEQTGLLGRSYGWEHSGMAEVRAGPDAKEIRELRKDDPSQEGITYENQCLFVRTLNVTLQTDIWNKLDFGEILIDERPEDSSSHHPPSSSPSSPAGGSSTTHLSQSTSASRNHSGAHTALSTVNVISRNGATQYAHISPSTQALIGHPSETLNNILLKLNPTARIAITEDKEWISVMKKDDTILPSTEELSARIMSSLICREEEGVLFWERIANEPLVDSATEVPEVSSASSHETELEDSKESSRGQSAPEMQDQYFPSRLRRLMEKHHDESESKHRSMAASMNDLSPAHQLPSSHLSTIVDEDYSPFKGVESTMFCTTKRHRRPKNIDERRLGTWNRQHNPKREPVDENKASQQSSIDWSQSTLSSLGSLSAVQDEFDTVPFLGYSDPCSVPAINQAAYNLDFTGTFVGSELSNETKYADVSGSLAEPIRWLDIGYQRFYSTSN